MVSDLRLSRSFNAICFPQKILHNFCFPKAIWTMASFYCYFTRILQGLAFFLVKARAFVTKTSLELPNLNYYERKKRSSGLSSKKKLSWKRPISQGTIENNTYANWIQYLGKTYTSLPHNCIMENLKVANGASIVFFKYTQAFNMRPMITLTFNFFIVVGYIMPKRETI